MSAQNINSLITEFDQEALATKDCLTGVLTVVSNGMVPSKEEMTALDTAVFALQEKYHSICEVTQSLVSADEMPPANSPVRSYAAAVENSQANALRLRIASTKAILEKFVCVKSLVSAYSEALAPFQSDAAAVLQQLTSPHTNSIETMLSAAEAPGAFLDALDSDSTNALEDIRLLEKVSRYYPLRVQWGLAGKQYFADADSAVVPLSPSAVPQEAVLAAVNDENAPLRQPEMPTGGIAAPHTAPAADASPAPASDEGQTAENTADDREGEAGQQAPNNEILHAKNKIKAGTPSASAFRKDLIRMSRANPSVRTILPLLTNLGALTFDQVFLFGLYMHCFHDSGESKTTVGAALDLLSVKGFLTVYDYSDGETTVPVYCLSPYCHSCMRKESIASQAKVLLTLSYGSHEVIGEAEISAAGLAAVIEINVLLLKYLYFAKSTVNDTEFEDIMASIKWNGSSYTVLVVYNNERYRSTLRAPGGDACEAANENLLIVSDNMAYTEGCGGTYAHVFVLKNDTLVLYGSDGKPLENKAADGPAITDDAGAQDASDTDETEASDVDETEASDVDETGASDTDETEASDADETEASDVDETEASDADETEASDADETDASDADETGASDVDETEASDADETDASEQGVQAPTEAEPAPILSTPVVEEPAAQGTSSETEAEAAVSIDSFVDASHAPTEDAFSDAIHTLLNTEASSEEALNDSVVNAVLLADGASLITEYRKSKVLSGALQLATGLFLREHAYSSECLAATFAEPEHADPCLLLASYLHALLTPATAYDFGLKNQADMFLSHFDQYFCGLQDFKTLFNKSMTVREVSPLGFSPAIIALLGSELESEHFIADMRTKASSNLLIKLPKTRMKALPVMYNARFGPGSDLYECMRIIDENRGEDVEYVEAVLSDYCDEQNGVYSLSMPKVEAKLDSAWESVNVKSCFKLEYDARDQALRQYCNRLSVMLTWVEHINSSQSKTIDVKRLAVLRDEISALIRQVAKETAWRSMENANVLAWVLPHLNQYLHGKFSTLSVFSGLLYTGVFTVRNDGIPDIDRSLTNVKYYEPWRNTLRHMSAPRRALSDIRAEILNDDLGDESGLVDNLHQLEMLGALLGEDTEAYSITATQIKEAVDSAEARTDRFKETLELAYTYNQINETEKETLLGLMTKYKAVFFENKDFACWRRFLEALETQIHEFAEARMKPLRAKLDSRLCKAPHSPLLMEANRLLEHDRNFAVTEEFINRFDVGETELSDELDVILHDFDYFSDFLSSDVFDPLLAECRRCNGRALKSFGWSYLDRRLPKEWTARLREDSEKMVSNWPVRKDTSTPAQIQALFSHLGFPVSSASRVQGHKEEMFRLSVHASPRSMADYRHPIASFGTQMHTPLNVIILYGNYTERQLVDTVSSFDLGGVSIVLIDRPLDKSARRLIGEIFHTQTSGQNPFLLIDQVLFLYLAMHQVTERIPALLKCTLPYTTYQPFVRDGGSTADEMFCGRTQELATIIDPNGACVVYGGRQLGKTALLERAESRCSKPDDKAFAVYINIINCKTEAALVDKIIDDVLKKTGLPLSPCNTIDKLCAQIDGLFRERKIVSLLLLLDEADNFLAAIADVEYKPIQPLIDLKRETKNAFKFVLAGLHNVCRAKNATAKNGVFGQLGTPLCVKPLTPTDALQLLSRPLRYLGFQIDRYPHLETILTNTNYYPGILQFFGYMLVETLSGQYAKYYHASAGNPPFTLQDEQLAAVMTSSDLNRSIRDKFRWSLELDQRYFMIARCITMLYHFHDEDRSSGSWLGFSVEEIISMANDYNIHCLENETHSGYRNLLDEMVEMGILNQPAPGVYRLRRNSFVDMIGENFETLDAEIVRCNEEA